MRDHRRFTQRRWISLLLALCAVTLLPFGRTPVAQAASAPTLVKDITPGPGSSKLREFVTHNGLLFFKAVYRGDLDEIDTDELWQTDGTPEGTRIVKDFLPAPGSTRVHSIGALGDSIYIGVGKARTGQLTELWKSDGTEAGTVKVADVVIPVDYNDIYRYPFNGGTVFNGQLFFAGNKNTPGVQRTTLVRTDGTPEGTQAIPYPGSEGQVVQELAQVGGALYFIAFEDRNEETRSWLYRTDGTSAGTVQLIEFPTDRIGGLKSWNGLLIFGTGLVPGFWKSDGTPEGTVPIALLPGETTNVTISQLFELNETLFFIGSSDRSSPRRAELWRFDETLANPSFITDLCAALCNPSFYDVTPSNGLVYFGLRLPGSLALPWRTDGTAAGTFALLGDLSGGRVGNFTSFQGKTYFHVGNRLWETDGSVAHTKPALNRALPVITDGEDQIAATSTQLFFIGDDGQTGAELWTIDGSDAPSPSGGPRPTSGSRAACACAAAPSSAPAARPQS
jgi:ELWxxDGT repeat protein